MAGLVFGFTIEGIGNFNKPLLFTNDPESRLEKLLGARAVGGLSTRMGSVDTTIEPFRNDERFSNYQFRMSATQEVGSILFQRSPRSVSDLGADISLTDTTVNLGVDGLEPVNLGVYKPIYVDAETLLLDSSSATGNPGEYTVQRGAYKSEPAPHNEGASVYDQTPYWIGRKVWFWSYERGADKEVLREILMVKDSFVQDRAEIIVKLSSALAGLDSIRVNLDPAEFEDFPELSFDIEENKVIDQGYVRFKDGSHVLKKDTYEAGVPNSWVRVKNTPRWHLQETISDAAGPAGDYTPDPPLDESLEDGFNRDEDFNEFLLVNDSILSSSTRAFEVLDRGQEVYLKHPLALCAALMLSTESEQADPENFDIFHPNFSLKLSSFFSQESIDEIHHLILKTDYIQMDQYDLGFDGSSVKIMGKIRDILTTYGFRLSIDNEGYLKFMRIGLLDVEGYNEALNNPLKPVPSDLLRLSEGSGDVTKVIEGTYGGVSWGSSRPFSVYSRDREGSFPPIQQKQKGSMTVTADSILPGNIGTLRSVMEARSQIQSAQMSRLEVKVADYVADGLDYSLGAYMTLEDLGLVNPWAWNSDGERVKDFPEGSARWIGKIIGRRYLPLEKSYELELIFTSESISIWRAPSAIVEDYLGDKVRTQDPSPFDRAGGDAKTFTKGDDVQFYNLDGTLNHSQVYEVVATSQNTVSLDAPIAEDVKECVLELSYLRTSTPEGYRNIGLGGELKYVDLAYVFLGNSDNKIGTAGDPGPTYGG